MEQVRVCPWRKTGAVANIVSLTFGREASIEYEPCWLATFFAAPYRTIRFLSSIYTKCTRYLLSCQGLIVLKYSKDRATVARPLLPCSLCVSADGSCRSGGCWYGYVNMYHTVPMYKSAASFLCVHISPVEEASHHPLDWEGKGDLSYTHLRLSLKSSTFFYLLSFWLL